MAAATFTARWQRPRRTGALLLVGLAHLAVILALLHDRGARVRASETVMVARLIEGEAAPRNAPPPPVIKYSMRLAAPQSPPLPIPEIVVQDAPSAPAPPAPAVSHESLGISRSEAPPVAARPGPPEVQDVQYARPLVLDYPPTSRRLNESGVVIVRVLIDERGLPVEVLVQRSSGYARLDAAALAAVRRAAFRPYRENGVALPAQALVPIRFELG